jgi:hypothetical protein
MDRNVAHPAGNEPPTEPWDSDTLSVILIGLGAGFLLTGILYIALGSGFWNDLGHSLLLSSVIPYALGGRELIEAHVTPHTGARIEFETR